MVGFPNICRPLPIHQRSLGHFRTSGEDREGRRGDLVKYLLYAFHMLSYPSAVYPSMFVAEIISSVDYIQFIAYYSCFPQNGLSNGLSC